MVTYINMATCCNNDNTAVGNLNLGRRREIAWEEKNDIQVVWLNGAKLKKRKICAE